MSAGLLVSPVPRTLLDSPAALFLGAMAVATFLSPDPTMSAFGQTTFYFQGLVPCLLVFLALQMGTLQKRDSMLKALVTSCLVATAVGIGQYFGQWLPYPIFFGNRIYSTVGSPVYLACHLGLGVIAAVIIGWLWAIPMLIVGIVLTGSRAGLVMVLAGLMVIMAASTALRSKRGLAWLLGLVLALLGGIAFIQHQRSYSVGESDSGRFHMRRVALMAIADKPWRGFGPEQFDKVIDRYRDGWLDKDLGGPQLWTSGYAHNSFLDALVAGGYPLFVAYLVLIASIGFLLIRHDQYQVFAMGAALFVFGLFQPTPIAAKAILALIIGASLPDRGYWFDREANAVRALALGISLVVSVFHVGSRMNRYAGILDTNAVAFNASRRLLPMLYR